MKENNNSTRYKQGGPIKEGSENGTLREYEADDPGDEDADEVGSLPTTETPNE